MTDIATKPASFDHAPNYMDFRTLTAEQATTFIGWYCSIDVANDDRWEVIGGVVTGVYLGYIEVDTYDGNVAVEFRYVGSVTPLEYDGVED